MDFDKYIKLPLGCYPFGVEVYGRGAQYAELHGGFSTYQQAVEYRNELLDAGFDDYQYVRVVKIETVDTSERDRAPGV